MPEPTVANGPRDRVEHSPLPDFCRLPALFALVVVGALTVTVMWLARNGPRDWSGYSVGMLFVTWLVLVLAVALCKLRPLLQRLPGHWPYAGVWLLIVLIVLVASSVARWLDVALQMQLGTNSSGVFVRDNVAIAALLGAAMLRYFYVQAQWQARLAAVTRAQVDALQARIRPHFLFNSMNTVAALIRVDPDAAERTVEDLSELFRAALGQHNNDDGTLGDELALIERYLAIEQLRLGNRLTVRREIDALPTDFPLPRLLLQPLVENAVRHGIQPLIGGGEVIMRGQHDGNGVHIEIINPLPPAAPAPGNGHGLDSVRQRVTYRYGPLARVEAGPQSGPEGERFVVRLHLPITKTAANKTVNTKGRRAMRVLIVDDEPLARARLAALLRECADVDIVGSVGDGESALTAIGEHRPDLLLLDINMPGLNGTALAQRLVGRARPQIIFCTAYEAHALQAFELGAVDYLLKPVRLERLRDALQRAGRRLTDQSGEPQSYLHGRLRGEEVRIALSEVIYLLADEKYVVVQHRRGELLIEESLRQLEETYPNQLIRLHRNCLVPPARLLGLKTLSDGRVLARLDGSESTPEISRRNLPAVRKLLRLG